MKECRRVSGLIELYREGERTPEEDRLVSEHVNTCPRCASVLRSVEWSAAAVEAARSAVTEDRPGPDIVSGVLDRIGPVAATTPAGGRRSVAFGGKGLAALGFRPAVAFVLFCVLVLAAQSGRDALEVAAMERRLAGASAASRSGPATIVEMLSGLADGLQARGTGVGAGRASATAIPSFLLPPAAGAGLFREYAKKYPRLAAIDPYDGLDDNERRALATEGAAFLEEFRSLIRKGER